MVFIAPNLEGLANLWFLSPNLQGLANLEGFYLHV